MPRGSNQKREREYEDSNYQRLTVPQVKEKLDDLSGKEMRQIKRYEEKHKDRKTLLEEFERRL